MKFQVNQHSKYAIHEQIKEQIRLAISLGQIGPGYALPSIRDVERELSVGRAVIHRAYRELQQSGILSLQPRKGVVVAEKIVLPASNHRAQKCEALIKKVFRDVEKLGVLQSSFASLLYQRALGHEQRNPPVAFVESIKTEAAECAEQVSSAWGTKVLPLSVDEFRALKRSDVVFLSVLTPFYDFERVSRKANRLKIEVAPVVLKFSTDFVRELASVLDQGKALLLLADQDFERHGQQLIGDLREKIGAERSQRLVALPLSSATDIAGMAISGEYIHLYVGNRIWDSISEDVKHLPHVSRPRVEIDGKSLQQAKVKLGLLV